MALPCPCMSFMKAVESKFPVRASETPFHDNDQRPLYFLVTDIHAIFNCKKAQLKVTMMKASELKGNSND